MRNCEKHSTVSYSSVDASEWSVARSRESPMHMAVAATDIAEVGTPLSLDAQLEALGIPVLPHREVRAHKRKLVQESRIGLYKLVGPFMYLLSSIIVHLVQAGEHLKQYVVVTALAFVACVVMALIAPLLGLPVLPFSIAAWAIVGTVVVLGAYLFSFAIVEANHPLYLPTDNAFMSAATVWVRTEIKAFDAESLKRYGVPEHLLRRAQAAGSLPGAHVHVDEFKLDPFLVLTVRNGLIKHTRYIGAWDTHNPLLDNL